MPTLFMVPAFVTTKRFLDVLISAGVDALARIGRVAARESTVIAFWFDFTSSRSMCHSGFHAVSGLLAIQVAKPSFSQISRQLPQVTLSPNHWWPSSCAT